MKKVLFTAVGLAVVYTAGAWFTGFQAEKKLAEQLKLSNEQNAGSGLVTEITEYKRGLFSSDLTLTTKTTHDIQPIGSFSIVFDGHIQHGPVLFSNGFGVGLFDYTSKVNFISDEEELNASIKTLFGDSIGLMKMRAGFTGTYVSSWDIQALAHEADGKKFTMAESHIGATGRMNVMDADITLELGAINFSDEEGVKLEISPIVGTFDMNSIEPGLNLANYSLKVKEIVSSTSGITSTASNISLVQKQEVVDQTVKAFLNFDVEKVAGPVAIDNLYYHIDFNNLKLDTLRAWQKVFEGIGQKNDPTTALTDIQDAFKANSSTLLQDGINFRLSLGADFMGGKPHGQWDITYKAPANGKSLQELVEPAEYLSLLETDLLVQAPSALLAATPAAAYVGTFIAEEGGDYVLKASMHDGRLMVGSQEIPQEQLLAVVGGMLAAMPAAADDTDLGDDTDMYDDADETSDDEVEGE